MFGGTLQTGLIMSATKFKEPLYAKSKWWYLMGFKNLIWLIEEGKNVFKNSNIISNILLLL